LGVRVLAGAWNFSLYHRVQTGSGVHPASYPMGTGALSLAWCSVKAQGQLYLLLNHYSWSNSEEIPHFLWKQKVHYYVTSPPREAILSQMNPIHALYCKVHSNIILPSTLRSAKCPSFSFLTKSICVSYLPFVLYVPPISFSVILCVAALFKL
jgi:hypothetical protein